MPTVVTLSTTAPVHVISERIVDDGRERHPNGVDRVEPGTPLDLIVHAGQSLRVVEVDVVAEAAEAAEAKRINDEASAAADAAEAAKAAEAAVAATAEKKGAKA